MGKFLLHKISRIVSFFFSDISWKKLLTFSIFVFVATVLWFMQIHNQEFETTIEIPIKYVSIPEDIILINSLPEYMQVKLRDNGLAMFSYNYFRQDTLRINVENLIKSTSNSAITLQGVELDQYLRNVLSDQSQIVNYTPIQIVLLFAPLSQKKIPVVFDGTIDLSPGYLLTKDIKMSPDSISVYGSDKDLNKLLYVYTEMDTIRNITTNREVKVNLRPVQNVKMSRDNVSVSIQAEAYTQRSLDVPVECINLPDEEVVKFFPSKVELYFFCGVSQLDSIKIDDFKVVVDYMSLKESVKSSVPVRITSAPDYARNITISPTNVEFIFEYK